MVLNVPRVDGRATTRRCTGSTCGSSSAWSGPVLARCRPGAAGATNRHRALLIARALRDQRRVRVQLQRRRRARLLPAVAPDRRAARGAGGRQRAASLFRSDGHGKACGACLRALAAALLVPTRAARAYRDFPALDRSATIGRPRVLARAHRRPRRSARDPAHRPELAGPERPVLLRQGKAARDRRRAHARRRCSTRRRSSPTTAPSAARWSLTERARATAAAAYGPLLPIDARSARRRAAPRRHGARGLRPARATCSASCGRRAICASTRRSSPARCSRLRGGRPVQLPAGDYAAVAGVAGEPHRCCVTGVRPARSGAGRRSTASRSTSAWSRGWRPTPSAAWGSATSSPPASHTLIVERGVSFAAFDERGAAAAHGLRRRTSSPRSRATSSISHESAIRSGLQPCTTVAAMPLNGRANPPWLRLALPDSTACYG